MFSPNTQFMLKAADAFMRAVGFVIFVGFVATAWRQVFG